MLMSKWGGSMSSQALESIGEFGDVRRGARGEWLFERVMSTGSLVLRQIGGDRAGEVAVNRFLSSPEGSTAEIVATVGWRTGERCRGRRIVAGQEPTEINFSRGDRGRPRPGPAAEG